MADEEVERAVAAVLDNWESIGVSEHAGRLYYPSALSRRTASGKLERQPVALTVVTNPQRYRARVRSRQRAAELGLDEKKDGDLLDELESYEILAFAIRDPEPPHSQHLPSGSELWEAYDNQSLSALWGEYDGWVRMQHPNFGSLNAEQMWQVIARVKAGADIAPLGAMPGYEQATLLLLMAREACNSPNAPSWLRSSETSTSG